jgi:flagellar hook assembly protein FlgD
VTSSPNPFNPSVTLRYTLPAPDHVTMKVFDMRGALVRTLLDGPVDQPSGAVTWNGRNDAGAQAASGLYFVETRAGDEVDVRKVTMLK